MKQIIKGCFLSALALLVLSAPPAWAFDPKAALEQQRQEEQAVKDRAEAEEARQLYERYRNKDMDKAKVNRDGTVTIGNLQWMLCSLGQKWDGDTCTGNATEHNWDEARSLPGLMNRQGGFAGHTDWRLPTLAELESLRVCSSGGAVLTTVGTVKILPGGLETFSYCRGGYNKPKPSIDGRLFPNTPSDFFWSSSPNSGHADSAWHVHFGLGLVGYNGKDYVSRVRLVRAGQ